VVGWTQDALALPVRGHVKVLPWLYGCHGPMALCPPAAAGTPPFEEAVAVAAGARVPVGQGPRGAQGAPEAAPLAQHVPQKDRVLLQRARPHAGQGTKQARAHGAGEVKGHLLSHIQAFHRRS